MRVFSIFTAMAFALLLSAFSAALASEWIVQKASQPARYSNDGVIWTDLAAGMAVSEGSTIFTGRRGRAMLRRGADTIFFAPNTLAAIAKPKVKGFLTEIVQRAGTIVLEIESRDRPDIRVRTPFLAAVVKGTRFEVRVGRQSALVKVRTGVAQVTQLNSGERSDVRARQTATVSAAPDESLRVQGPGPKAKVSRVAPAKPVVEPIALKRDRAASKPVGKRTRNVPASAPASVPAFGLGRLIQKAVAQLKESARRTSDGEHIGREAKTDGEHSGNGIPASVGGDGGGASDNPD